MVLSLLRAPLAHELIFFLCTLMCVVSFVCCIWGDETLSRFLSTLRNFGKMMKNRCPTVFPQLSHFCNLILNQITRWWMLLMIRFTIHLGWSQVQPVVLLDSAVHMSMYDLVSTKSGVTTSFTAFNDVVAALHVHADKVLKCGSVLSQCRKNGNVISKNK